MAKATKSMRSTLDAAKNVDSDAHRDADLNALTTMVSACTKAVKVFLAAQGAASKADAAVENAGFLASCEMGPLYNAETWQRAADPDSATGKAFGKSGWTRFVQAFFPNVSPATILIWRKLHDVNQILGDNPLKIPSVSAILWQGAKGDDKAADVALLVEIMREHGEDSIENAKHAKAQKAAKQTRKQYEKATKKAKDAKAAQDAVMATPSGQCEYHIGAFMKALSKIEDADTRAKILASAQATLKNA